MQINRYKICIWTTLGVSHEFVLSRSLAELIQFRKYLASSNVIEFTHRATGHVAGFMRLNVVNYTIDKIDGGEDVGDQHDVGTE